MPYTVTPTDLPEVLILELKVFGDDRGFFFESFNQKDFQQSTGLVMDFVQDNHSKPAKGCCVACITKSSIRKANWFA